MNSDRNTPRFIGAAFLFQAAASAVVGLFLLEPLKVPGNIVDTMVNFANNVLQVRAGIVVEMITVTALVVLSALLYQVLKKQNRNIALVALGLRLTEVALLAVSRIATFTFLRTSQAFVMEGQPAYLQTLGTLAYDTQDIAYSLSMVFFTLGGDAVLLPVVQITVRPTGSIHRWPHSSPLGTHRNRGRTVWRAARGSIHPGQ